jgi:hypothetical protein
MKKINRSMFFSALVVLAYVLSACSGVPAVQSGNGNDQSSQSGQAQEVVFTGTVDSMGGGQWTVSGQAITVDGATSIDANIVVGDNVKVEARVGQDGSVTAVSIEISGADNANANSNGDNQNASNANDNASNSNDNQSDNSNAGNSNGDNSNSNGNGNDNSSTGSEQEVSGVVEAITTDSITINGVVYKIADFTEFKGIVTLGDQVKVHVIVNEDGTFTIREIEKTAGTGIGGDNSNGNGSNDNSNSNGNDSNSNDDNSNSSNGNDDNGNDDNGNDNSNDNGGGGNDNGGNGNG